MFGKRFQKELDMIEAASKNDVDEKAFREYCAPLVEAVTEKYIRDRSPVGFSKEDLLNAGWSHFAEALRNYRRNAHEMLEGKNTIFYFSTYYTWYIRQGILEYVNVAKII